MMSTGGQVVSVKLVEPGSREPKLLDSALGLEFLGSERSEHVKN